MLWTAVTRFYPGAGLDYLRQPIVRLAPSVAKALDVRRVPAWTEDVRYHGRTTIVGTTNAAEVTIERNRVTQRLFRAAPPVVVDISPAR